MADSLELSGLCYARSDWLTKVRNGFALITIGMTVLVVCIPVLLSAIPFPALNGISLPEAGLIGGMAGLLVALYGMGLATESDNERGRIDEPVIARKVVQRMASLLETAAVPFGIGLLLGWEKLQLVGCACMACVLSLLILVFGLYIRWFGSYWRSARICGMTIAVIVMTMMCGVTLVSALLLRLPMAAPFGRRIVMAVIPRGISSSAELVSVAAGALIGTACALWAILALLHWRLFRKASAYSRRLEGTGLIKRPWWLRELQK